MGHKPGLIWFSRTPSIQAFTRPLSVNGPTLCTSGGFSSMKTATLRMDSCILNFSKSAKGIPIQAQRQGQHNTLQPPIMSSEQGQVIPDALYSIRIWKSQST